MKQPRVAEGQVEQLQVLADSRRLTTPARWPAAPPCGRCEQTSHCGPTEGFSQRNSPDFPKHRRECAAIWHQSTVGPVKGPPRYGGLRGGFVVCAAVGRQTRCSETPPGGRLTGSFRSLLARDFYKNFLRI